MRKIAVVLLTVAIMGFSSFTALAAEQLSTDGLNSNTSQEQSNVVQNDDVTLLPTENSNSSTPLEVSNIVTSSNSLINAKEFGVKGDGIADDTAAIQELLNKYDNVYIPEGTYKINVDNSLKPRANQTIVMSEGTVLEAIPSAKANYAVIRISGVNNVNISGGKIVGERYEHTGTTGTWGMGITILNGASNIVINDIMISDCWGDGIYLGGSPSVSEITIDNVTSDNNRRQGISVTNANSVTISNSKFINTNGTAPEAGIDIEPNANETAEDINIINTQCYNNKGSGIALMGISGIIQRVEVVDSTMSDNSGVGIKLVKANDITISNGTVTNNLYGIEIPRDVSNTTFANMNISNNRSRGVSIVSSKQTVGTENIVFENSIISNNSQSKPGAMDGIRIDNSDSSGYITNVEFSNTQFSDDQVVPTQRYGITVGSSKTISGLIVNTDCDFEGNKAGDIIANNSVLQKY